MALATTAVVVARELLEKICVRVAITLFGTS